MKQVGIILVVPLDILPGVYCPHEVDMVAAASLYKFLDLVGFLFGIWKPPIGAAVVWVIFRPIYVGIHFESAEEVNK